MTKLRVAVVQAGSAVFDTPQVLERMAVHCEEAGHSGAELVVFPDAYVGVIRKGLISAPGWDRAH